MQRGNASDPCYDAKVLYTINMPFFFQHLLGYLDPYTLRCSALMHNMLVKIHVSMRTKMGLIECGML